jgi:AraC-like DNA-binding protein/DNA-binding NarL/FixJ family response regulator
MFRVLLVDDEPLVLSGIKHLIDWEKNGCIIAGTASSGKEALELLGSLRPEIIICDIAMPDISGMELLKKANTEFPETVFIMLTNYQEFELAREALRNRAAEYLLKNRLEILELEQAIRVAALEWENRNTLRRLNPSGQDGSDLPERIEQAVLDLIKNYSLPFPAENIALLRYANMLSGFALAVISLDFSQIPEMDSPDDITKLLNWEKEITRRLAASFFPKSIVLSAAQEEGEKGRRLLMFMWDLPRGDWEIRAGIFREQLKKTSLQITRVNISIAFSHWVEDHREIESWRGRLPALFPVRIPEQEKQGVPVGHAEIIARVKQYIIDNMERHIMLNELANHVAISPGYLSTIFKKELNQNLMDYINMIKTERACALLREEKYRIYEISYMLGFENAYYFTRVFRRYTGLSPSEYQKKERAGEEE